MCRLRLPRRAPRNVAHESTVTRSQSAASANAISNLPGSRLAGSNLPQARFWPVSGTCLIAAVDGYCSLLGDRDLFVHHNQESKQRVAPAN